MKPLRTSESSPESKSREFNASPPLESGVYLGFFVPGHHAVMKHVGTQQNDNNVIAREVRFLLETDAGDE